MRDVIYGRRSFTSSRVFCKVMTCWWYFFSFLSQLQKTTCFCGSKSGCLGSWFLDNVSTVRTFGIQFFFKLVGTSFVASWSAFIQVQNWDLSGMVTSLAWDKEESLRCNSCSLVYHRLLSSWSAFIQVQNSDLSGMVSSFAWDKEESFRCNNCSLVYHCLLSEDLESAMQHHKMYKLIY